MGIVSSTRWSGAGEIRLSYGAQVGYEIGDALVLSRRVNKYMDAIMNSRRTIWYASRRKALRLSMEKGGCCTSLVL